MIEVEKKFSLSDGDKATLLSGAKPISTKTFTDVYYDNASFDLTCHDIWLRQRGEKWELKIAINAGEMRKDGIPTSYRELETEAEIAIYLKLPQDKPLPEALKESVYTPFATLTTTRAKYTKEDFTIDVDSIDFGYNLIEIEKLVETESEIL